ncbi:flagellar filament capping protein FliD [Paenibacillus crassostreae]|uniref:Flagellar hook-associated protein 2 n=1 Tax=Paenibacillus crassostreae TaxID=1763538 RepID=A0A162KUC5_9BACL|nr:flagellar filament capping protein FliD [Paenibacillus crassostreae]AOZ93240.1 flagellar cap protein FliD [Paenibacillus crassostreae]OAB74063.1 flagellar cap protein FliD [Paenibacillus crassostreae]
MVVRISGLASGMDVDAMVKTLMTAAKYPLNNLNQQKQITEWKREGYRQVSTTLVSLNEKLSTFNLSSSINAKKATVTGASNITATTTGAATNSVLNVSVGSLASASSVVSTTASAKPGATKISELYSGTETNIKIGNGTIEFKSDETIDSLVSKINNDKTTGVTAVYDQTSGQMSLTSSTTGDSGITVSGGLLTSIGITTAAVKNGSDAKVTINGIVTTQSSNTFTVNGVTISINGATPAGQTSQIQVSQDTDKMFDTIKSFVDSYNATLSTLNGKTSEERYRTYTPLTTEQKADMTEDEVKLWETKAKSGMLKSDSIIDKTLSDMRADLIGNVTLPEMVLNSKGELVNKTINITQIGITTGSYSEKGKLILDETKLRAALAENPEDVYALFGQTDNSSTTKSTENDGIFNRVKKINNVALTSLYDKAGTSKYSSDLTTAFLVNSQMGDQLRNFDTRITEVNRRLTLLETRYYKQFSAMETAINKFNSTSGSLTSMLS